MKITTLLMSLCFCLTAIAQNYDFGKVSKEELQEKFNPLDSSANATYLYKYRKTYFDYIQDKGFQLITEIHERIKIYNQEGFDYATQEIGLYKSSSDEEKVKSIKAITYNMSGNNIDEVKLKKDGIFKTERSRYYNQTKFAMPNIKPGSVIEYSYKIISPFYTNIDAFQFQHSIPVKKLEATFESPEYFVFRVNTKGFLSVTPNVKQKNGKITFRNKNREGWMEIGSSVKTTYSTNDVEYKKNISIYNLINVPALKEELYVNNINNYRSSVKYELSYKKFPNSAIEYYATTWEDVVKKIYEGKSFGTELTKTGYFEKELDAIISTISDPNKRIALIYDFVKSKVKWNGNYSKYVNDGVKKAYKEQAGNVAEINLMLTSMLRHAGLKANPVLISTRNHGIPLFPTREGYNYVVSCVQLPQGMVLLDATNKYGAPNILPYRTLNWEGRIIKKGGTSQTINLYPKQKSKNTVSMLVNLSTEGDIDGSFRSVKTSHLALNYRNKYNDIEEDDFIEELENEYEGLEISEFKVANALELSKPVMETYKFLKESQADIIGDKIYFSPLFFFSTSENPFKLETREFPVDFGYPTSSTYRISVNLPEGYKVETSPKPVMVQLPDDLGVFGYKIVVNETSVQVIVNTDLNQSIVSSLYYDLLKEFFKQMIEKENEQIVLTKS